MSAGTGVSGGPINTCDPSTSYCDVTAEAGTCIPWIPQGAPCATNSSTCQLWDTCQDICVPVLGVCTPQ